MADIFNMTDTWNDGTTTFTAIKMDVTDTASAAASLLMDLQVGGASKFSVLKGGQIGVGGAVANASRSIIATGAIQGADFRCATGIGVFQWSDLVLARDAANTLAQRNGTNPQAFNIYNTYTDASNYERGSMRWNSNVLEIGSEAAGTGAGRSMRLSGTRIVFGRPGLSEADISFVPRALNVLDIAQASGGAPLYQVNAGALKARFNYQYAWVAGNDANTAADTGIARNAAGVVKITDGSTGTGELIFIVPTTDPGITGALWNDAGTLSISA